MSNAPDAHDEDCKYSDGEGPIDLIIEPRVKDLGDGFVVRRILPFHKRRMVGPFIFFDHFGPVTYKPGNGMDVRPHPHIGLATVTYLFEGAIGHKDTLGNDLVIRPGAVNWMTAGRGIVHSERTPAEERAAGQALHGLQTWVALPESEQDCAPDFVHHAADTLPVFDLGGAEARMIAGSAFGHASPVEFPHEILYFAVDAANGAAFTITADPAQERAIYVVDGEATIAGCRFEAGAMAVLKDGEDADVSAQPGAKLAVAGGAPMDGPRKIEWNFVATDKALIDQAADDWRASIEGGWQDTRFSLPPGETEWIPYP